MIIKVYGEAGVTGAQRSDEIEMPDEATDDECEDAAREWFFNHYNYSWCRADD